MQPQNQAINLKHLKYTFNRAQIEMIQWMYSAMRFTLWLLLKTWDSNKIYRNFSKWMTGKKKLEREKKQNDRRRKRS